MFRRDDKLKKGGTARSRTDIVEEARKLRMEREKRRYTERHVIAVQAVVRGHLARLSFQQQLREDVDRKLQDIATLKQMLQKEFILPSSVILPLVSSVLFVAKLRRSKSTTRIDATDATKFEHMRQWCGECFTVNPEGLRRPLSTVVPAPMFPEAATIEDQYGFGYIAQQGSFSILRRFWKKKTQWTTKLMQNLNLFKSERPPRRPSTAQDSPSHVPDVAPFRNAAFTSLVRLCGLFLWRWKSTDKKNSPEMLSFLSFYRSAHGTSLVTTLWTYFQETHDVDATAQMHEQGFPLPLAEVERVVVFFKHVLYRRYWLAPRTQTTHPFGEYAVDAATWLLQSLYNRCSRRPFSNVTSWSVTTNACMHRCHTIHSYRIVKDLDGDDMLESVLNEDPKGQMLLRQMPYLLPYADRVRLFQALLKLERERYCPLIDIA
ncbi:hypothetical protein DYB32_001740 [Aphanomyces invadans]|uniref:HECT-type E3 ubiquitin transferase n=1 Tax=Aphanomyces invadans TaxID=157072 RepID=A0A418B539_9STRA|nr:hypothetical protein DYB32_001740 [Aphanomyces invadans]